MWDLQAERLLQTFIGHTKHVYTLQFDESKCVTGSADNSVKVWDRNTGRAEMTLEAHANPGMSTDPSDVFDTSLQSLHFSLMI